MRKFGKRSGANLGEGGDGSMDYSTRTNLLFSRRRAMMEQGSKFGEEMKNGSRKV